MARPPIIISNGGIAEELANGLVPGPGENEKQAWKIIMRNVKDLNKRAKDEDQPFPVAKSLSDEPDKAKIIWRLSNEEKHERETGVEAH